MNTPELIKAIMENEPEYGSTPPMLCVGWDYKRCRFVFHDVEEDIKYNVDMPMLLKGFVKLKKDLLSGKIKLDIGIVIYDAGNWDAEAVDALVQYAIFGEARYG